MPSDPALPREPKPHPLWLRLVVALPLGAVMGLLAVLGLDDVLGVASPWVAGGVTLLVVVVLVRTSGRIGRLFSSFFELLGGI